MDSPRCKLLNEPSEASCGGVWKLPELRNHAGFMEVVAANSEADFNVVEFGLRVL